AVILESTFTSVVDAGKHYYPWFPIRLFARFNYNTLEAVKKLNFPVFITHSKKDEVIPYKFGEQLFKAANEPKLFRELEGTHNEGFYDNPELYKGIWQDWFDALNQSPERQ
ncbi:MAG: alpha/beta hydrolase, partial [Planctomycetota bacterium]